MELVSSTCHATSPKPLPKPNPESLNPLTSLNAVELLAESIYYQSRTAVGFRAGTQGCFGLRGLNRAWEKLSSNIKS